MLKKIALLAALAAALSFIAGAAITSARAAEPVLSESDDAFLRDQATRIVASARLAPGRSNGKWKNRTHYVVHVPGGNMGYPAFWVRDAVMMLGSDLVSVRDLEDWIRLMCSVIRNRDWHVRPGVVVPAYALPDHINFNGKATFFPGTYETGKKQGGIPWGKYPPLDDHFYFVKAVYEHWKMSHKKGFLLKRMKTAFGRMRLLELCERAYQVAPVDPESRLCVAGDIHTENAKDFGFCDAEAKSGKLLFTSVLKFTAARELAVLFRATGQLGKAEAFEQDAAAIRRGIPAAFFHPTQETGEGWLYSATGVGNQPDVWGSAFAIYSDAVDHQTARKVALALARSYRDKSAVREGCVSHILSDDAKNPNGWQVTLSPRGEYQNGGYWGAASGWYIAAINSVDVTAARDMSRDYIQFLRDHIRADGAAEAWEWFNPDSGKKNNPLYVATVALPYLTLLQANLLRPSVDR